MAYVVHTARSHEMQKKTFCKTRGFADVGDRISAISILNLVRLTRNMHFWWWWGGGRRRRERGCEKVSLSHSKLRRDFRHYIFANEEDGDGSAFSSGDVILLSKRKPQRIPVRNKDFFGLAQEQDLMIFSDGIKRRSPKPCEASIQNVTGICCLHLCRNHDTQGTSHAYCVCVCVNRRATRNITQRTFRWIHG